MMCSGGAIEKARKRLQTLLRDIKRYDRLYYQENISEISDFEYDCLQAEIKALYQQFPDLKCVAGPGSDLKPGRSEKIPHLSPMLSLSNTYSKKELFAFDRNLTEKLNAPRCYLMEPKVDGMAINLIYEKKRFVRALTRGNGYLGEDVTIAVRTISDIPCELDKNAPNIVEVRGEVYVARNDFNAINVEQERLGQEIFSNARNLASGSVKLLNVEEVRRRCLHFVAHGIGQIDESLSTQAQLRQWLQKNHFPCFPYIDLVPDIQAAWDFIEHFHQKIRLFPYNTDGVVVKLNDRIQQSILGATARSPRWAIAYKFEPESAETQLTDVTFQVGRTGVITPVAELIPIELAGSRITRATLHNFNEVERLDIRIGDWVKVQRAGEVIPAIVKVNTSRRKETIAIQQPKQCPACGARLIQIKGEVAVRCPSLKCPEQLRLKIVHFASKDAMDIVGMGPKVVDILVRNGWLKSIEDVFQLWHFRSQWIRLEGFGELAVDQLLNSIESAKSRSLSCLIYGLSIPGIGLESAKSIAQHFQTLKAIENASQEALQTVPLVGLQTAQTIVRFFQNETNRRVIETLQTIGWNFEKEERNNTADRLWDEKIFALTGIFARLKRSEVQQHIEALGGRVSKKVSNKIFALIVGKNPSNKLQKARQLQIPIWDEAKFLENLKNAHRNR